MSERGSRNSSRSSSRRWGRNRSGRSAKSGGLNRHDLEPEDYIPQGLHREDDIVDETALATDSIVSPPSTNVAGGEDDYFGTSPPTRSGLTGSISTLFRRVASRERPKISPVDLQDKEAAINSSPEYGTGSVEGAVVTNSGPESSGKAGPVEAPHTGSSLEASSTQKEESNVVAADNQQNRGRTRTRSATKRIYTSYTDDDSDESLGESKSNALSRVTTKESEYLDSESLDNDDQRKRLKRFRGFSTSINSLFLDESLICTSIGCFGLILSNRTEYLLQVRDQVRGVKISKKNQTADKRSPTKVFSYLLLLTLVMMFLTFVIWGFGNGNVLADDLYNGGFYNVDTDDDGARAAAQNHDDQANDKQDDYYFYADNQGQNGDDGYNQNYNNDDKVDDGYGNVANDDYSNNYNNDASYANDDANDVYASDDAKRNDDQANNDDAKAVDDYYAAGDDDDNNARHLQKNSARTSYPRGVGTLHKTTGIFKLRDCQEGIWDPSIAFAKDCWHQEATATRSLSDTYTDDFDATHDSSSRRDLASDVRAALFLTFLLFLGVLGRRRRMRTRFQLVRARAQDDRLYEMSGGRKRMSMKDELEDKAYEVACSHTILGCYPVDPPSDDLDEEELGVDENGYTETRKKSPKHDDFVSRGFSCLMASCCGRLCKCWFQCLSVCALAQEAREMRLLLPPRYQRIDFITHQPFSEYQKDVNELRRGWMGKKRKKSGILPHYYALSRLSRYILFTFGVTILAIIATLLFNPRAGFSWPDAVLLIATFVQSFLVLYIVHWIFHKSDLSLDAVIKFFAAGFVIAVPSAVFFEGVLVNLILACAWTVYELALTLFSEDFALWMAKNFRFIWIVGELFNAYIVAAVTEELCKYYTFRSMEHPDLIFLTGLDRKSHDEHAADGGEVAYPFGSHKVSDLNRSATRSFESLRSIRSKESLEDKRRRILTCTNTAEEYYEDENDVRTYRQKAAAVTTGMISVAVGLACAENMMYVFLLGGARGSSAAEHKGDIYEEWIVLLFRSVFPIHALAAAMQSINMIRKFVEGCDHNNHRIGVGRIILPAVILHGTFDAILMGINVYVESSWDSYLEENEGRVDSGEPYNPTVVNFVAWCSIVLVTLIGFLWYYRENRNQRQRLILLEEEEKADGEEEAAYVSPAVEPGVAVQGASSDHQNGAAK